MSVCLAKENIRRPCRLRGSREIEIVQPRDHLVPVTPLPIDAATGGAAPKRVMPNPDSLRDEPLHVLGHRGDQDLVAERATGERIDESEGQLLGDFADLLLQIVRADLDRPGNAGREFFVPREEDPILGPRSLNQGSIRSRLRVCGVVSHEPQPASEAPEHVIAQESHRRTTAYSRRTPSPRGAARSNRNRTASSAGVASRFPARVGAEWPPKTSLATKTLSSSARPRRRNDQMMVLPPSTRRRRTPRAPRRSRRTSRSTSSFPIRKTSTSGKVRLLASDVTINVGAVRSRTLAPAGVLPLESSTIRRGFRPFTYSAFTVSFGSSFRTVPIPTRTASAFARSAWTRRRSSSLLKRTGFPPESAIVPSTLIVALMTTCGRTSIRCAVRINNLCGFGAKFIYRVELRGSVRSHEGSPGPRRRPALPSDRRRDRGNPIRCRRPRDPAGSESGARRPPLRDGLHRRRRRPDPSEAAGPTHLSRNRCGGGPRERGSESVHEDPTPLSRSRDGPHRRGRQEGHRPFVGEVLHGGSHAAPWRR